MAPHAETAGQVQGVHCLGLEFPKHRPAHGLQLLVQLLTELGAGGREDSYRGAGMKAGVSEAHCLRNISGSAETASVGCWDEKKPSLCAKKKD